MSQNDIMNFFKKTKNKYFTVQEISEKIHIGHTSINRGLKRLWLCKMVDRLVWNIQQNTTANKNINNKQYVIMWKYR